MHTEHSEETKKGKQTTFILDTAANPSFVNKRKGMKTKLTRAKTIQTPNGTFVNNKATKVPVKTWTRSTAIEAIVHEGPENVLSTTPIADNMGTLIFDTQGAVLLDTKIYNKINPELWYFACHNKNFNQVETQDGAICLNTVAEPTSETTAAQPQQTNDQQNMMSEAPKDKPQKQSKAENLGAETTTTMPRAMVLPDKTKQKPKFKLGEPEQPDKHKLPKYKWRLIMNHASPDALTRLARNKSINVSELNNITTTRNDMTCRGCREGKLRRAPHKRKEH